MSSKSEPPTARPKSARERKSKNATPREQVSGPPAESKQTTEKLSPPAAVAAPPAPEAEQVEGTTYDRPAGTPVYSPLPDPLTHSTKELHTWYLSTAEWIAREAYAPLPWPLESLIGSTWRDLQTGEFRLIHHIGITPTGQPTLTSVPAAPSCPGVEPWMNLGYWVEDRYIIEHWTRVDHCEPQEQLYWFGVELEWLHQRIKMCQEKVAEYQGDRANRTIYETKDQYYQQHLHIAGEQLRTFATHHGLSVPIEILNSGLLTNVNRPTQLALL